MSKNLNYTKNGDIPFKKGPIRQIIRPIRPRIKRLRPKTVSEEANTLYIDLVQVFANHGIILSNVYTLAMALVKLGWTKHKKIENS